MHVCRIESVQLMCQFVWVAEYREARSSITNADLRGPFYRIKVGRSGAMSLFRRMDYQRAGLCCQLAWVIGSVALR